MKDLQDVACDPWHGQAATHNEMGTIGNPTPQLITQDIRGEQSYESLLDRYAARAEEAQQQQSQEIER